MNLNKAMLIGRLGAEPEVKTFNNGDRICTVNLAVDDPYWDKQKDHWVSNTSWIRCVFQNQIADRAMNLHKGDEILVEGKIKTRSYTSDKDDQKKFIVEVKGTFKKGRPGKASRGEEPAENKNTGQKESNVIYQNEKKETKTEGGSLPDEEDDLPF